jgi:M6 family metalloprotease-like protein
MLLAQTSEAALSSTLGNRLTPHGNLHVLVIVVRYHDAHLHDEPAWPDSSEPGRLPEMFRGDNNEMFCATAEAITAEPRTHNLSDYYWTMSQGAFVVTGEVYPVQVPVSFVPENARNFSSRQQVMNQEAIDWIAANDPDFDWSRFDQRTNKASYSQDNSQSVPDSVIDYVYIIHRAPGGSGISSACSLKVPNSPYRLNHGQTVAKAFPDAKHNWPVFVHELAHHMYDSPHLMGANRTDGDYYYIQMGWGMMSDWVGPFFQANAWEAWWVGWMEPQVITEPGRYVLADWLTKHDALRIRVPGTDQYLWLENHQKHDPWDQKLFYQEAVGDWKALTPTTTGIYAYVVGEFGSHRSQPRLNPFSKAHANMIRTYNGQGNFDYEPLPDRMQGGKGANWPAFRRGASNPIMGQNDFQTLRHDVDGNDHILVTRCHGNRDAGKQEGTELFVEEVNGELTLTGNRTGDAEDALVVGDEIGLSGIFPILNRPRYDHKSEQFEPILLNGMRIDIVEQQPDGSLIVDIRFDDWQLRRDQRWCGPLRLDSLTGEAPLHITSRATLTLDLSGTPDRLTPHPVTGTFTNPSTWTIADARQVTVGRGATLLVQRHSELQLTDQAQLFLARGSTLRIDSTSTLTLTGDSQLWLARGAKLELAPGATLSEESLAHIRRRGGKVIDRR